MRLGRGGRSGLLFGTLGGIALGILMLIIYLAKSTGGDPGAEAGGFAGLTFLNAVLGFPLSLLVLRLPAMVGNSTTLWVVLLTLTPVLNWGAIGMLLGSLSDLLRPKGPHQS